jgi:hypothetical protein
MTSMEPPIVHASSVEPKLFGPGRAGSSKSPFCKRLRIEFVGDAIESEGAVAEAVAVADADAVAVADADAVAELDDVALPERPVGAADGYAGAPYKQTDRTGCDERKTSPPSDVTASARLRPAHAPPLSI